MLGGQIMHPIYKWMNGRIGIKQYIPHLKLWVIKS
jgi:hypothetical protein